MVMKQFKLNILKLPYVRVRFIKRREITAVLQIALKKTKVGMHLEVYELI